MFFDDQESGPTGQLAPEADPGRESQSPLLLHDMQSSEAAFGLPPAKRRSQQAAVAVLLVVGAVGGIFAMRQLGLGPATSLAEINAEYKPEGVTSGNAARQVLADLERSRKAVQVPADHIKHDPFELNSAAVAEATDNGDARRLVEEARLAREEQERALTAAFDGLTLQSVMEGTIPVARINGEIVRVGMTVAKRFVVSAIEGRDVTLVADGRTFVLSLTDPQSGRRPGQPRSNR